MNAMLDELDPSFSGKIAIKDILSYFRDDLLIYQLAMTSRPSDLIGKVRDAIFPDKAYRLHHALVDRAEGDMISEENFIEAFREIESGIDNPTLIAIFKVTSKASEELEYNRSSIDSRQRTSQRKKLMGVATKISITHFIQQIYIPKYVAEFDEVDRCLLKIKQTFISQQMPYEALFNENG
jgi:hypothetical protein